jgi:colicin import membrane protein
MNAESRGILGTLVFHSIILIIFLIFGFTTPLPLPEEQGILINFGDQETGSGIEEPRLSEIQAKSAEQQPKAEQVEKTETGKTYLTQENEEAPSIKDIEKPKEKKPEKKTNTKVQPVKKETVKEEKKVEQPFTDPRALYTGKKTNIQSTGSEGVNSGEGNQGSPDGSTETDYHGEGAGSGSTPRATLQGRVALSLPVPKIDSQKEGKVVVEIKVDRNGKVVSAVPGVKGSTTVDSYLLSVSKNAALSSRFDSKPDAQPIQSGIIEYTYRLR